MFYLARMVATHHLVVMVQKNLATIMSVFGCDGGDPSFQYLAVLIQKNLATVMSVFGRDSGDPSSQYFSVVVRKILPTHHVVL